MSKPTKLTARAVASLKAAPGRRVDVPDGVVPGLTLRISPAGSRSWTVLYRTARGRQRRLTLGRADVLTLAGARDMAREVIRQARAGADPATERQQGRLAERIEDLAALYLEKWAKPRKRSWRADRNLLDRRILPRWRGRAIVDITRGDCRRLIEQIAEDGAPVVANRTTDLLSKMFAFAVDRDLITVSPAIRLPRPGIEQSRDRVLREDEIRTLWHEFGRLTPAAMVAFYKLRLVTAARGGEVAAMRWTDLDLTTGWWTIPAAASKNKLPHRVPLSPLALDIIGRLERVDEFVLSGARGKRQQAEAAATFTVSDFRGHDLRRTAASFMAASGVSRLVIGRILNHVERDVTAVYDRHSYDAEKRQALDLWDQLLRDIVGDVAQPAYVEGLAKEPRVTVHLRLPINVYDAHARCAIRDDEPVAKRLVRALEWTANLRFHDDVFDDEKQHDGGGSITVHLLIADSVARAHDIAAHPWQSRHARMVRALSETTDDLLGPLS